MSSALEERLREECNELREKNKQLSEERDKILQAAPALERIERGMSKNGSGRSLGRILTESYALRMRIERDELIGLLKRAREHMEHAEYHVDRIVDAGDVVGLVDAFLKRTEAGGGE